MLNAEKLTAAIDRSGIKLIALADMCGINRKTLSNKMAGKCEFKASEIATLTDVLRLSRDERDAIFFAS